MIHKIADWLGIPNVENPLLENTISNRLQLLSCQRNGCITHGAYYGLPQAHCRRCGGKNYCAMDKCAEWIEPF